MSAYSAKDRLNSLFAEIDFEVMKAYRNHDKVVHRAQSLAIIVWRYHQHSVEYL